MDPEDAPKNPVEKPAETPGSMAKKPDTIYIILGVIIVLFILIIVFKKFGKEKLESAKKVKEYVIHYTDWCPACKSMIPIWDKVTASITSGNTSVTFRKHNETQNPTPGIEAIPTIIRYYEDGSQEKYPGGHSEDRLRTFLTGNSL